MAYTINTAETITHGTVTLGKTTYQVEEIVINGLDDQSQPYRDASTYLIGPRGARYLLRPFIEKNGDSGLRQVISMGSGAPLRIRGTEVRVHAIGNIIEVAK